MLCVVLSVLNPLCQLQTRALRVCRRRRESKNVRTRQRGLGGGGERKQVRRESLHEKQYQGNMKMFEVCWSFTALKPCKVSNPLPQSIRKSHQKIAVSVIRGAFGRARLAARSAALSFETARRAQAPAKPQKPAGSFPSLLEAQKA